MQNCQSSIMIIDFCQIFKLNILDILKLFLPLNLSGKTTIINVNNVNNQIKVFQFLAPITRNSEACRLILQVLLIVMEAFVKVL